MMTMLEQAGFVDRSGKGSHRNDMKESARYAKIVEWSEEDGCYVGSCPGLMFGGCHGDDEKAVFEELCQIVEEMIEPTFRTSNFHDRRPFAAKFSEWSRKKIMVFRAQEVREFFAR